MFTHQNVNSRCRLRNVYCLNVLKILVEKVISSVIFDTLSLTKELFFISARRQVVCKMFFFSLFNAWRVCDSARDGHLRYGSSSLVEKMTSVVLFGTNRSFKRWNTHSKAKELFIKVSMARCSRLVIFFFKEKFCVSARVGKSLAMFIVWSVPKILVKKMISLVLFDTNRSF